MSMPVNPHQRDTTYVVDAENPAEMARLVQQEMSFSDFCAVWFYFSV